MIKFSSPMRVVEHLTTVKVIALAFSRQEYFYFSASSAARLFLKVLGLSAQVKPLDWRLMDIVDEKGTLLEEKISGELTQILNRYEKEVLVHNAFVSAFLKGEEALVRLYLLKILYARLIERMNLINFLSLYCRFDPKLEIIFSVSDRLLVTYLAAYAQPHGIQLTVGFPGFTQQLKKFAELFGYTIVFPVKEFLDGLFSGRVFKNVDGKPLIALWYNFNPVSLKKDERSALFLFLSGKVPLDRVLIYFENPTSPCTRELIEDMDKLGVRYVVRKRRAAGTSNVPIYVLGRNFYRQFFISLVRLKLNGWKSILRLKFSDMLCLTDLLKFNAAYASHYDFFQTLNIKVNVGLENFASIDVPKYLALKHAGGVRVCYQISNIVTPNLHDRGAVTDIYFAFGPYYRQVLEGSRSFIDKLLYCGYITDYCFKAVKQKSETLRQRLLQAGASFVVTFFDEGFGSERYQMTRQEASVTHDFFARLVLDDPTIAVIFKPKKVHLSPDSRLTQQALKTKRFVILNEGRYLINTFPAEAALAADITVGLLQSGTTNLESLVAGVPTFYLDHHKLYFYDEYQFGRDTIVFDSLEKLKIALENLSQKKSMYPSMKEMKDLTRKKDPFQDGGAVDRIGHCLAVVLESFDQGKPRELTLNDSAKIYAEKFYKDNKSVCV